MAEDTNTPELPEENAQIPIGESAADANGEELPEWEETADVRDIEDMVDFYQTIRSLKLEESDQKFKDFCSAYRGINKGCGCQRQSRVKNAQTLYISAANLDEDVKTVLKDALGVKKIRLFHDAGLFAEF